MEKDNKIKNVVVETYAEDMAKVIENGQSGLIKKIIHEDEEHETEKRNLSPESKRNKYFVIIGFIFLLLGFSTLFYFFSKKDAPTVPIAAQFVPLIFNDKNIFFEVKDFKKEEIAQTVFNGVNTTEVKNKGVEGIYLTENKGILGLRRFLTIIKSNFIPDNQGGGGIPFINDHFLMGVVNSETKDFFILLKMRSIPDIFDSLHAWEGKMFFDLRGFFGFDITPETKYLLTKEFQDGIVENKNARILYDNDPLNTSGQDRKIVMMYILADDNSVIITNTENAAREVMLRLASGQIKK